MNKNIANAYSFVNTVKYILSLPLVHILLVPLTLIWLLVGGTEPRPGPAPAAGPGAPHHIWQCSLAGAGAVFAGLPPVSRLPLQTAASLRPWVTPHQLGSRSSPGSASSHSHSPRRLASRHCRRRTGPLLRSPLPAHPTTVRDRPPPQRRALHPGVAGRRGGVVPVPPGVGLRRRCCLVVVGNGTGGAAARLPVAVHLSIHRLPRPALPPHPQGRGSQHRGRTYRRVGLLLTC